VGWNCVLGFLEGRGGEQGRDLGGVWKVRDFVEKLLPSFWVHAI
jgi:hypothetical protein